MNTIKVKENLNFYDSVSSFQELISAYDVCNKYFSENEVEMDSFIANCDGLRDKGIEILSESRIDTEVQNRIKSLCFILRFIIYLIPFFKLDKYYENQIRTELECQLEELNKLHINLVGVGCEEYDYYRLLNLKVDENGAITSIYKEDLHFSPNDFANSYAIEKIEKIRERYLSNTDEELDRLKNNDTSIFEHIVPDDYFEGDKTKVAAYLRSLELIESLNASHYVLNHGADSTSTIVTLFTTEFMKKITDNYNKEHFSFRLKSVFEKKKFKYLKDCKANIDNDVMYSNELLSTSFYSADTKVLESCLDFFRRNENILNSEGNKLLRNFSDDMEDYLEYFKPSFEIHDFKKKLEGLIHEYANLSSIFSIVVHKKDFKLCGYTSKTFGIPTDPYGEPDKIKYSDIDLTKYQLGYAQKEKGPQPQARLHTAYVEEMQLPVCCFSSLDDDEFKKLTQKIENLVEAVFNFGKDEVNNNNNLVAV
ncbi:MAG: hypothetical protein WDZ28_06105 [Simkaniaceae bacterium]